MISGCLSNIFRKNAIWQKYASFPLNLSNLFFEGALNKNREAFAYWPGTFDLLILCVMETFQRFCRRGRPGPTLSGGFGNGKKPSGGFSNPINFSEKSILALLSYNFQKISKFSKNFENFFWKLIFL